MIETKLNNQPFYIEGNRDEACLFLHGFGGSVLEMSPLAVFLYEQGFAVCGNNYPGHDKVYDKMPESKWEDWYATAVEGYKKLEHKYSKINVIAFSAGCPLSLNLLQNYPVNKVVFLAPFFKISKKLYFGLPDKLILGIKSLCSSQVEREGIKIADQKLAQQATDLMFYRTFNLKAMKSLYELIDFVTPIIPHISIPSLIIHSVKDDMADISGAEFLYKNLASQKKELFLLKDSLHSIMLDLEREIVFKKILEFLG